MSQPTFSPEQQEALKQDALRYILPSFADNAELAKGPKVFVRGEGCYLYDMDGKRYLDTFASLLTTICGHHRPEIKAAVLEQMDRLEFFPNYVDTFTVPLVELARKLARIMPGELSVSFFINSGSEANETALKMARQYYRQRGQPQRYKVVARRHSFHGTTLGGTSATGLPWFREYFEPLMPGFVFAPAARCCQCELERTYPDCQLACLRAMENLIEWEGPESVSAVIMDPLPGSNIGYPLPPEGYLQGVRELCDKHGILLIFDEVQSGFGKTGKWFFCEHAGVVPDIITVGKGFTGGYIPLGAVVTTPGSCRRVSSRTGLRAAHRQHLRRPHLGLRRHLGQHRDHRERASGRAGRQDGCPPEVPRWRNSTSIPWSATFAASGCCGPLSCWPIAGAAASSTRSGAWAASSASGAGSTG